MYTTQAKVLQYLGLSALPSPLSSLDDFIAAAVSFIDKYTGRSFDEGDPEDRKYDGDSSNLLLIDEASAITTVKIYDNSGNLLFTLGTGDYVLYPENKTAKNAIKLKSGRQVGSFQKGSQNVTVSGTFGGDLPDAIAFAATQLVGAMVEDNYINATGDIKSESLGEYSVSYQSVKKSSDRLGIYDILDLYREIVV